MENEEMKVQETAVVEEVKTEATNAQPVSEEKPQGDQRGNRKFDRNAQHGNRRPFNRGARRPEVKEFDERVVYINKVSKTVKGGKRLKFSALVVIGNGKGKYGFAMGKSNEVPDAIKKAVEQAKRNLHFVHLINAASISHDVVGKFGATSVFLKPAKEGTGIIAGGPVRAVLELTGVRNVYSKVYGSRTAINVVRATHDALSKLKEYKSVQALRGLNANEGGEENVK